MMRSVYNHCFQRANIYWVAVIGQALFLTLEKITEQDQWGSFLMLVCICVYLEQGQFHIRGFSYALLHQFGSFFFNWDDIHIFIKFWELHFKANTEQINTSSARITFSLPRALAFYNNLGKHLRSCYSSCTGVRLLGRKRRLQRSLRGPRQHTQGPQVCMWASCLGRGEAFSFFLSFFLLLLHKGQPWKLQRESNVCPHLLLCCWMKDPQEIYAVVRSCLPRV